MSRASEFAAEINARCTEPSVPVTSKEFVYTCAAATDVRATFERFRVKATVPQKLRRAK